MTVDELLDKVDFMEKTKTTKSIGREIVYKEDGETRESKMISFSFNGNEKALTEYLEPARIKGMRILSLNKGDDIWLYSQRTKRVRKIASHQRKQSATDSDFSYEDMSLDDRRTDYIYSLKNDTIFNNVNCYSVEFLPKDKSRIYSKITFYFSKDDLSTQGGVFFDENNEHWKTLTLTDFRQIINYNVAFSATMENHIRGTKTVITTDSIEIDIPLDENIFSERSLKN